MTAFIERLFSSIFGDNAVLATIIISMVPIIELKGSIPFSMSKEIFGGNALSLWQAFGCGLLGSSLVVPLLALIYAPIIRWLKRTKLFRKLGEKIENRVNSKKQNIEDDAQKERSQKKKKWGKVIGVFLFVAIPLPLTGVWTGTCIAVALGLNFITTCVTVILGNVVAGLIITLVSMLFGDATLIFFYILLGVIAVLLIATLIKSLVKKAKSKKSQAVLKENMASSNDLLSQKNEKEDSNKDEYPNETFQSVDLENGAGDKDLPNKKEEINEDNTNI